VSGVAPILSSHGLTPSISILPATPFLAGSMSAADKTKLNTQVYLDGGNAFGAQATIGTTDGNDVEVITGGTRRTMFKASGQVWFGPVDPTFPHGEQFAFVGAAGYNRFSVDPDGFTVARIQSGTAGGVVFRVQTTSAAVGDEAMIDLWATGGAFSLHALPASSLVLPGAGFGIQDDSGGGFYRLIIDSAGRMAIGPSTAAPDPSAALHMQSQVGGFLPPRLTTVQRNAIAAPADGLIVFNYDTNAHESYSTLLAAWVPMEPQSGGPVSLVGGQSAPIACNLTVNSVIVVTVGTQNPGAGVTAFYAVKEVDRLNGLGLAGRFVITALQADGVSKNGLDTSTNVRWAIIGL